MCGTTFIHPEKRVYAKHHQFYELDVNGNVVMEAGKPKLVEGPFAGHYLQGLGFNKDGNVIQGERSDDSKFIEALSILLYWANYLTGEPLGETAQTINRNKTLIVSVNTAMASLRRNMEAIIQENYQLLAKKIKAIITDSSAAIVKQWAECDGDATVMRTDLKLGLQNMQNYLAKAIGNRKL